MFNADAIKSIMDLFANPVFRQGYVDFAMKMQQEGMEAARKAWNLPKGTPFGSPEEFYAKMEEFSALMGFVPSAKYEELRKENENLKKENAMLKDMVRELQNNLYKEGAEMARQSWQNLVEKQLEVNKELAKSFFDQFKDSGKDK